MKFETLVKQLKYTVLREVAKDYWEGDLWDKRIDIPKRISPGPKATRRCCIYKERAIVAERIKLALGGDKNNPSLLEVIESACDQCPFGGRQVTDLCRGCLAHRCAEACPKNAISFDDNYHAHINKDVCINCGLCAKACQFGAIANRRRPCEAACKINAIHAREDGISEINYDACTECGACSSACPFGAIRDKSYITKCIDILKNPENDGHIYAIIAPSIPAQFAPAKLGQVLTGIKKLGFSRIYEAALGADLVAYNESKELSEEGFAISSCCTAFVNYIHKAFPELVEKISKNLSPMAARCKAIKEKYPFAKTVFIGPCIAKKKERFKEESAPYVDNVITFEELQALLGARQIEVEKLEESPIDDASYFGRIFAHSGGLSDAVNEALKEQNSDFVVKPVKASGLDQCKLNLNRIKKNTFQGNFLEGMACCNGCIGGPGCLTHQLSDQAKIDRFSKTSTIPTIKSAIEKSGIASDISSIKK